MGLNCYTYQNITLHVNLNKNLSDGHANMSHGTSHGSCVSFRVPIMSCDMIQCGMMWKRI